MKLREYKKEDEGTVQEAIDLLRAARDKLKAVGAERTLAKVRRALRSATGAHRHVIHIAVMHEVEARHG